MLTDASTKHEDKPAIIQQLAKRGAATPEQLKSLSEMDLWGAYEAAPHGSPAAEKVAKILVRLRPEHAQKAIAKTLFPEHPWHALVSDKALKSSFGHGGTAVAEPHPGLTPAVGHEAFIGEPSHKDLVDQEVNDFLDMKTGSESGGLETMTWDQVVDQAHTYVGDSIPNVTKDDIKASLADAAAGGNADIPLPGEGAVSPAAPAAINHVGALAKMPGYAQDSLALMVGDQHIGYLAKLPGPMKKNHGKKYAHFSANGTKYGYVNSLDEVGQGIHTESTGAGAYGATGVTSATVAAAKGQIAIPAPKVKGPVALHEVGSLGTGAPKNSEPVSNAQQIFGTHDFSSTNNQRLKAVTQQRIHAELNKTVWKGVTQEQMDNQWAALMQRKHHGPPPPPVGFRKTSTGWDTVSGPMAADVNRSRDESGYMDAMQGYMTSHFVHTWAGTSNDENPLSLAVQDIAQEIFNVQDAHQWHIKNAYLDGYREANRPLLEEGIKAAYKVTQDLLKQRGFGPGSTLKLKRRMRFQGHTQGVNVHYETASDVPEWAKINVGQTNVAILRPLNSFGTNMSTTTFAGSYQVYTEVPVEKVFSIPGGGFGALHEYEVVVIGGNFTVRRFK
jgi:hypothetical protein